jgi:hypothetical protein
MVLKDKILYSSQMKTCASVAMKPTAARYFMTLPKLLTAQIMTWNSRQHRLWLESYINDNNNEKILILQIHTGAL